MPSCEVLQLQHVLAQDGPGQAVAWVESGLFQVLQHVGERWHADIDLFRQRRDGRLSACAARIHAAEQPPRAHAVGRALIWLAWQRRQHRAGGVIAFGMDEGVIQRLFATGHLEEARRLHERCRAEARDLEQLLAALEGAVLRAPGDDVVGDRAR